MILLYVVSVFVMSLAMGILVYPCIFISHFTKGLWTVLAVVLFPLTLLIGLWMGLSDLFVKKCRENVPPMWNEIFEGLYFCCGYE